LKILFVIRSLAHFSYISTIVDALARSDNRIFLYFDSKWSKSHSLNLVKSFTNDSNNIELGWALQRSDVWRSFVFFTRELRSYTSYLKRVNQSQYYLIRWNRYLPKLARNMAYNKPARKILSHSLVYRLLKYFECMVPPDQKIYSDLITKRPDVVVATPMNMRFSEEVEYVKAANALKIPTVVPVLSWDNLTTKGLFHVIPNLTIVWNAVQYHEAVNIHGLPENKVVITGAPFFDKWFDNHDMVEHRDQFCRRIGLDPLRPFILYLGSSANIAKDETWMIEKIYKGIKNHPDPQVRELNLLVRPHPSSAKNYKKMERGNIIVWPKEGALPETSQAQRDFYNSLCHSKLTIGINTSGIIDAIINDKPCLTVITKEYLGTQKQATHFNHLLDADVLEVTYSLKECLEAIRRIICGKDHYQAQRLKFVKHFIRPRGTERVAGELAAKAIELTAKGFSVEDINAELS
jgi:hypothetical protein